jgi:NAD-dependent SIR2 family protein deacetylase
MSHKRSPSTHYLRKELLANIKDIYKIDSSAPESSTPIPCPSCGKNGLKPATVLYGNSIPSSYEKENIFER